MMRKVLLFAIMMMVLFFSTAALADVRAGGMPELTVDPSIKTCDCNLFPECCAKPAPAPEPAPVPPPPPLPAPLKEKVVIKLNVQFDTDKAVVKDKYNDDIKRVADFMKEFPDTTASIEGHTDNIGSAAYNQKLSEKRANGVRQYLIDKFGIDGSRITATGYGLAKPVAGNDTEEGRKENRRVEAVMEAIRVIQ